MLTADAEMQKAIRAMQEQLLIVLIQMMGGEISISTSEVDEVPRGKVLMMTVDADKKVFHFSVASVT